MLDDIAPLDVAKGGKQRLDRRNATLRMLNVWRQKSYRNADAISGHLKNPGPILLDELIENAIVMLCEPVSDLVHAATSITANVGCAVHGLKGLPANSFR
jgi:hypothetical protein